MSKSETSWYREGNISLVTGSKEVTGEKTYWEASGIKPGDMLTIDNGSSFMEIDSVTDNNNLLLRNAYTGDTKSNSAYAVIRNFNSTMASTVAAKQADILVFIRKYINGKNELVGKSAFDLAVENGFNGSEADWLESLKGAGEIYALESRAERLEDKIVDIGELEALDTEAKGTVVEAVNEIVANTGALNDLETEAKGTIVAAINEANAKADQNTANIGTLDTLKTAVKSTIIEAVNEVFETLTTTKATAIANATKLSGIEAGANKYVHPSYTARTGAETSNQTPAFGGTFNVSQVASDGTGHVSSMTTRTVKIPNATATTGVAGLMSAGDKSNLDALYAALNMTGYDSGDGTGCAGLHNCIYRGANLGTSFTAAQKTAIANGSFANMWIGDYWTANVSYTYNGSNYNWSGKLRIAGFDCQMYSGYWYKTSKKISDYLTRNHHVVVVPDTILYEGTIQKFSSDFKDEMLQAGAFYETFFGASYLEPMTTKTSKSVDRKAMPMTCEMVVGYKEVLYEDNIRGQIYDVGGGSGSDRQNSQLPLFSLNPGKIPAGANIAYWLYDSFYLILRGSESTYLDYNACIDNRARLSRKELPATCGHRPYCLLRGVTTDTFQEYDI